MFVSRKSDARGDRGRAAITGGILGGEGQGEVRDVGSGLRNPVKGF